MLSFVDETSTSSPLESVEISLVAPMTVPFRRGDGGDGSRMGLFDFERRGGEEPTAGRFNGPLEGLLVLTL